MSVKMGRPLIGPKMQGAIPLEIALEAAALAEARGVRISEVWREIVCEAYNAGILDTVARRSGFVMSAVEGE